MTMEIEFIPGPLTTQMPRNRAEAALQAHPAIKKGSAYAMEQLEGRWVAAVVHTAENPFGGGGPADAEEESPSPKSEGPDDSEPSEDKSGDSGPDDAGLPGEEGLPGEDKGEEGKGGELHQVLDALHAIADALGVPLGMADPTGLAGPEGPSGPPGMPPPGPPDAHGGPPPAPAEQHVVHERVTKPGETPPGGTPIGAPAFASVREDHPWAHVAGKVASFEVAEKIGNAPLPEVEQELTHLASEIGYHWKNLREATNDDGDRVAVAVITRH